MLNITGPRHSDNTNLTSPDLCLGGSINSISRGPATVVTSTQLCRADTTAITSAPLRPTYAWASAWAQHHQAWPRWEHDAQVTFSAYPWLYFGDASPLGPEGSKTALWAVLRSCARLQSCSRLVLPSLTREIGSGVNA
jgi:hypothetical protein